MQALIYNIKLEVIASHTLPSFIEACEWVEQYLGWNSLKRIETKSNGKLIKVLTEET